jgi:hypothetical protein
MISSQPERWESRQNSVKSGAYAEKAFIGGWRAPPPSNKAGCFFGFLNQVTKRAAAAIARKFLLVFATG